MMRPRIAILVLLLITMVVSAESEPAQQTWNDVVEQSWSDSGSLGGISVDLSNDSGSKTTFLNGDDWPTLIEVYTATWCSNCVLTETIMDSVIDDKNTLQIHYHRFIGETQDPFGAQSTDDFWLERYAPTSIEVAGGKRLAPSNIFDGERFHVGTMPISNSIENDFSVSLNAGSTLDKSDFSASLGWTAEGGEKVFNWNISIPEIYSNLQIQPMIFFIEEVGYFPEGGNGAEYYNHILRDIVKLPSISGEMPTEYVGAYDGEDLSAVLVFNWYSPIEDQNSVGSALPAPAIPILLSFFAAALLPRRDD